MLSRPKEFREHSTGGVVKQFFWKRWGRTLALAFAFFICTVATPDVSATVIINEIHYNPDVKTEHVEFIELFNAGSTNVSLGDWERSGGTNTEPR